MNATHTASTHDLDTADRVEVGSGRVHERNRGFRSRFARLACTAAVVTAVAVGALPVAAHATTSTAYAETCYSTPGFWSCLRSYESWTGSSASSSGRYYWCGNTPILFSNCYSHSEGSYWDGSAGAWEDWANVSYSMSFSPYVKDCVYLRLDVRPNGQRWERAWSSGPLPFWVGC